jgi:hypothetical protein
MEGRSGSHPLCQRPHACQAKGKGLCRSCNIKAVTAEISSDPNRSEVRRKRNLAHLDEYRADPAWRARQSEKLARLHRDAKFAEAHRSRSSALLRSINLTPEFQEAKKAKRERQNRRARPSVGDAARALLASEKRPMSNTEIAEHLKASGMKISSVDPNNTIGSVMARRSNAVGDVVRVEKGVWGLGAWHGGEKP